MCQSWKLAANIREAQELKYIRLYHKVDEPGIERLSFTEFLNILMFVVPKLKYAKIVRHDESSRGFDAVVEIGRFEYIVTFDMEQQDILMNVFAMKAKNVETLKINSFDGVAKQDWENFFQVNRVTNFGFTDGSLETENSFFHDFIHILPLTVEQFEISFYTGQKNVLLIQEVINFISSFILFQVMVVSYIF